MGNEPKVTKKIKEEYERILDKEGEERVYRHALGMAVINVSTCHHPELVLLDQSEAFFSLYRQTGSENYFTIGRCLRRAAHRLYRQCRKTNNDYPRNLRFLNIVK